MKSRKGGYKLVSLQLVELTTMESLTGLYGAIVNSHDKPLLISDIVIDGERKNNVYCRAEKGTNKYTIKNVYGYDIEVTNQDAVTIKENPEGIELPTPTPEDDGSLVGVNVQGKYVLKPNPLGDATQADNGKVLEVINGAWGIGSKKATILDASAIVDNTLTAEQRTLFKGGVHINGEFLGMKNPVFYPFNVRESVVIGATNQATSVYPYSISDGNVVSISSPIISIDNSSGVISYKEKQIPVYPSNTGTFTLKMVNGTLTWVQDQ